MKTLIFDIETGPLPEPELLAMMPPFDPAEVRVGNIKDPDKIAAKLRECEAAYKADFLERAALDPLTGRVLAIGYHEAGLNEVKVIFNDANEAALLRDWWQVVRGDMGRVHQLIGFNCHLFDLPFLIRRSWKHRVAVPVGIRHGRYWSDEMVDLRTEWQLGDRQARGSLDSIAKHLGLGGKSGDGKQFAEMWKADRDAAMKYLANDLELTARIAEVLGVIQPIP